MKVFKTKLRQLKQALESQQLLFNEQQALQQALIEEQKGARRLEGEASAIKLQDQASEARAKLEEMASRLSRVERDFQDCKAAHRDEVLESPLMTPLFVPCSWIITVSSCFALLSHYALLSGPIHRFQLLRQMP